MTSRSKAKPKMVVVVSDIHIPYHDEAALKAWLSFVAAKQPYKIVLNGDIADFASVSSHGDASGELLDEIEEVNGFLDTLQELCPQTKIHFNEGNHEDRLTRFIASNAASLKGITSVPELLRLKQRKITWSSYGKVHFISPKLGVTHGVFASDHFAKQHLIRFGCSIIVGHTHRPQLYTMAVAGEDSSAIRGAFGLGCLCPVDDIPYIKGPSSWSQGFGVFYILPTGHYTPYIVNMTKQKFVWDGEVFG